MVHYLEQIIELLEPKIGCIMATSVIKRVCRQQGIDPLNVGKEHIEIISDSLFEPLNLLAGDDLAQKMVEEMKNLK